MAKLLPEIPNRIITKAPSADLWEGQTDEQEIGMSYEILDNILQFLNENKDISNKNISQELIIKVKDMIKKSYHKRNMPPIYPRL